MLSSAPNYQALELMFVGQAALEGRSTRSRPWRSCSAALGLISLALKLVLSRAQDCKVLNQTVALVALDAITRS